ncbi:MAG: hypothetical protein U5J62_11650 [Desulfurivibrio sp.]|nr:hypothetical protein [Desulfurivibrio sp.]
MKRVFSAQRQWADAIREEEAENENRLQNQLNETGWPWQPAGPSISS